MLRSAGESRPVWPRAACAAIALLCLLVLAPNCGRGRTGELRVVSPRAQGFDPDRLAAVERRADEMPYVQSLLVLRNSEIVSEGYYDGCDDSTTFNVKSVSKSILSALVGIALHEGHLDGLDQAIYDFFPEYYREGDDPRKRSITIRHLLTMTANLRWIENGPVTAEWLASDDWVAFFVGLPLSGPPGESFIYSTAGTHALSVALTKATGLTTRAYAEERLFAPAGMTVRRWDRDPRGYYWGGSEMYMTARDMARFGVLYLDRGVVNGRQVVPGAWIDASTDRQVILAPGPYTAWFLDRGIDEYGYLWWRKRSGIHDIVFAWGYGGQFIFLVPDLRIVVVLTSSLSPSITDDDRLRHELAVFDLLENMVLPSLASE